MCTSKIFLNLAILASVIICALLSGCQGTAGSPACTEAKKAAAAVLGPYELDEEGFITNWLIIGPFPNPGDRPDNKGFNIDYLQNYGGEAKHVPFSGMQIEKSDGTTVAWAPYEASYSSRIDLCSVDHLGLDYEQEDVLVYAACWLKCEKDMSGQIRVGSDDGYKLWLDHKLIGAEHVYRAAYRDQESYPVNLSEGMHFLLIKVDQDYGTFEFMLRVVTPDGSRAPGIKIYN
ncbi:MAG: hypothetical protein JSW23_02835 [Planctomycetota bacterium]|nr:MAG: hypothetical protein JSW23_02835 [Planctomycetota bacterium]